jgi:hypothetical protein
LVTQAPTKSSTDASRRGASPAGDVTGAFIERITVRIRVGTGLMAATDDPIFLRLTGASGREFRLLQARHKSLRRGSEDVFVLGSPDSKETSVAHPELNDPTRPPLSLEGIERVTLVKGTDPLPNVRGVGEMDDRVLIEEAEVVIQCDGQPRARFHRHGPHWLGLICGLSLELPRVESPET